MKTTLRLLPVLSLVLLLCSFNKRHEPGSRTVAAKKNVPVKKAKTFTTYTVTSTVDGNNTGELRWAITNATSGSDIIDMTGITGTITLTSTLPTISTGLTINGPGPGLLTVSGNNLYLVFYIVTSSTATINISGLTIASAGLSNPGLPGGGAIYHYQAGGVSTLNVTNCTISGNSLSSTIASALDGAGILSNGALNVTNCTFSNNAISGASTGLGGAIYGAGSLTVTGSTFFNNAVNENGGAIFFDGSNCTISNSTFTGNTAEQAGAVENGGNVTGTMTVTNCTISGNTASGVGGGIYNAGLTFNVNSSIIAANSAPSHADVSGTFTSNGYNLIGDGTGATGFGSGDDQVGNTTNPINPMLAGLANNGGPTETMALSPKSEAVDGDPSCLSNTDQRGVSRPQGLNCDIGAFELVQGSQSLVVTNTNDNGPGSLRDAINFSNSATGGGNISFTSGLTGTILLDSLINITNAATITGPGASTITVSGGNAVQCFNINTSGTVSISGLTIANGYNNMFGGGGGILDVGNGNLSLSNCVFSNNSSFNGIGNASASGGAICDIGNGNLTLSGCSFTKNNSPYSNGGAIFQSGTGTTTITGCTFNSNGCRTSGGAIFMSGSGGITNCTFSSNSATSGGALAFNNPVTISNCTISLNSATYLGGGVYFYANTQVSVGSSIIAGNTCTGSGGPDIVSQNSGSFTSLGNNIIGIIDSYASGFSNGANNDQVGSTAAPINPLLAALGNYGGSTQTMSLLPGSPAIDAGGTTCPNSTDQRGIKRPQGSACDIGAFESEGFTMTPVSGSTPQTAILNTAFTNPLGVTVTANNAVEPVDGGMVTFTFPSQTGASCTTTGSSPVTISGDAASLGTATANAIPGGYQVTASATGASSVNFSLTNGNPVITTAGSLTPFTACVGSGSVTPQSFTVSGTGLIANLVVTAPSGFGVSINSASGYSSSLSLSPTTGTVGSTIIYILMEASSSPGPVSGSITCSSTSATTLSVTVSGTVYSLPAVAAISGTSVVTVGKTITLADATSGGTWSAGNTNASVSTKGVVTGKVANTTCIISYTVTANGCSSAATKTINIYNPLTATVTAGKITCPGGTTTLTVNAAGGAGDYQYSLNGGKFQSNDMFTVYAGVYVVVVEDKMSEQLSLSGIVIGQPAPLEIIVDKVTNATKSSSNGSFTVSGSGGTSPYTYSDNGGTSFQSSGTFSSLAAGTYKVSIKDKNGCEALNEIKVVISTSVIKQSAVADTEDSVSSTVAMPDGADSMIEARIFPNPTQSYFTLELRSGIRQTVEVVVYDVLGHPVYHARGEATSSYRFGETFANSMYFVKIIHKYGIKVLKVIKQ